MKKVQYFDDPRWDGQVKVSESSEAHLEIFEPNPMRESGRRVNAAIGVRGVRRGNKWQFWLNGDDESPGDGAQTFSENGLRRIHLLISCVLNKLDEQK